MPTDIPPLTPGNFFHIYNRGNNGESLFPQERNYAHFIELWWKHTYPIFETWAYCLLGNHFHVAGWVKETASDLKEPGRYFSNFFNAYSRSVNIAAQRTGALFERPFKRIPVMDEAYLMRLIVYIHQNPQKHGFSADFRDWKNSSYHALLADAPTRLRRDKMMELFGSREDFIRIHQEIQPIEDLKT